MAVPRDRDWLDRVDDHLAARTPVTVIDARFIDDPVDADEMLGWCMNYADDGDSVSIHHPFCRTQIGILENCTCSPVVLILGARA
jgi:hypothetical protein